MSRKVVRLEDLPPITRGELQQGVKLYESFTGDDGQHTLRRLALPQWPKQAVAIGLVDGLLYSAVRDGELGRYLHEFKGAARPELMVRPDGKPPILLVGGFYTFTERGIVDD